MAGVAQNLPQLTAAAGPVKQIAASQRTALANLSNGAALAHAKAGGKLAGFAAPQQSEAKPWMFGEKASNDQEKIEIFNDEEEQMTAEPQAQEFAPIDTFNIPAESEFQSADAPMGADLVDAQLDALSSLDQLLAEDNAEASTALAQGVETELSQLNSWKQQNLPCSVQLASEIAAVDRHQASETAVFGESLLDETMTDKSLSQVLQAGLGAAI